MLQAPAPGDDDWTAELSRRNLARIRAGTLEPDECNVVYVASTRILKVRGLQEEGKKKMHALHAARAPSPLPRSAPAPQCTFQSWHPWPQLRKQPLGWGRTCCLCCSCICCVLRSAPLLLIGPARRTPHPQPHHHPPHPRTLHAHPHAHPTHRQALFLNSDLTRLVTGRGLDEHLALRVSVTRPLS